MLKIRSRRKGLPFWGLLSASMILYGGGVLFGWQPVKRLLELLYPNGNQPAFETRDKVWGWAFLVVGGLLGVWYIWRYIIWGPILSLNSQGIRVGSPITGIRRLIPWSAIEQVYEGVVADQLDKHPVLCLKMRDGIDRPRRPAGVRSTSLKQIWTITARDWDIKPSYVVQWVALALSSPSGPSPHTSETPAPEPPPSPPPPEPPAPEPRPQTRTDTADSEDVEPVPSFSGVASAPPVTEHASPPGNLHDILVRRGAIRRGSRQYQCYNQSAHPTGDRSPSLIITPDGSRYHCSVCGESGALATAAQPGRPPDASRAPEPPSQPPVVPPTDRPTGFTRREKMPPPEPSPEPSPSPALDLLPYSRWDDLPRPPLHIPVPKRDGLFLPAGEVVAIVGEPKTTKTTLLVDWTLQLATLHPVAYIALEGAGSTRQRLENAIPKHPCREVVKRNLYLPSMSITDPTPEEINKVAELVADYGIKWLVLEPWLRLLTGDDEDKSGLHAVAQQLVQPLLDAGCTVGTQFQMGKTWIPSPRHRARGSSQQGALVGLSYDVNIDARGAITANPLLSRVGSPSDDYPTLAYNYGPHHSLASDQPDFQPNARPKPMHRLLTILEGAHPDFRTPDQLIAEFQPSATINLDQVRQYLARLQDLGLVTTHNGSDRWRITYTPCNGGHRGS